MFSIVDGKLYPTFKDYQTDEFLREVSANKVINVVSLLERQMDVNMKNSQGFTPLMAAASKGNTEMIQVLLTHGADVDMKDRLGMTALQFAAMFGKLDVVDALIEAGADLNVQHVQGYAAVHLAAIGGHELVVRKLLDNNALLDLNEDATHYTLMNCLQNLNMGVYFLFLRRMWPISIISHVTTLVVTVVYCVCAGIYSLFIRPFFISVII